MILRKLGLVLLLLPLVGFSTLLTAGAQGLSATPVTGSGPIGVLTTFPVDVLPGPHAEVWFLRMTLDPGGLLPPNPQSGPTLIYVERGEITLVSNQTVTVSPARETATLEAVSASPEAAEFQTVLHTGESALVSGGATLAAKNDADQPATFLALLMFSALDEASESGEDTQEPVGLTTKGISVANAEFPAVPGTIVIERIQVAAGETLQSEPTFILGTIGLELGALEQGSAKVTFTTRSSWLWPNMLGGDLQELQPLDLTATAVLTDGDGYSTANGWSSWTVTSAEPLVVLRAVITIDV